MAKNTKNNIPMRMYMNLVLSSLILNKRDLLGLRIWNTKKLSQKYKVTMSIVNVFAVVKSTPGEYNSNVTGE